MRVINQVEPGLGVQCETKSLLKGIACVVGKPDVWVCGVDEDVDGVREKGYRLGSAEADGLKAHNKVPGQVLGHGEGYRVLPEA